MQPKIKVQVEKVQDIKTVDDLIAEERVFQTPAD